LPAHVEWRVVDGDRLVVIADCGVERHAAVEERLVWLIELAQQFGWRLRAIKVVTKHDHQVEAEPLLNRGHLVGDLELSLVARAVVADHGELECIWAIWHG
jgi:hypothetical protein